MSRKIPKRLVFFLDIAGVLSRKLPEGFDAAKLADICKDTICFLVESRGKDGDDDILREPSLRPARTAIMSIWSWSGV